MFFVEGLRLLFVFVGLIGGDELGTQEFHGSVDKLLFVAIGVLVGYVVGGVVGRSFDRGVRKASRHLKDVPAVEVLAASVMGTTGLVISLIIGVPIVLLWGSPLSLPIVGVLTWMLAYFGIRIGMAKASQVSKTIGFTRRIAPGTESEVPEGALVLDTSAVMERAIWVLGKIGMLPTPLIVPRVVID